MASVTMSDEPSIATNTTSAGPAPARSHPSPSPSRRTSSPPPPPSSSMTMQDPIMTLRRRRRRQSPDSDLGRTTTTTRRSSLLSDYSCDARDGLFSRSSPPPPPPPQPPPPSMASASEKSTVASASLAFALLPALAGVLFKDGHAVVTDIMLLALAGVFLHWSVTQPWIWYHDAQQVRLRHSESAVEDDDDDDAVDDDDEPSDRQQPPAATPTSAATTAAATATTTTSKTKTNTTMTRHQMAAARAVRELYLHEVLALVSCALLPLLSAYLLHAIRAQLSRPSEGLVSNYNLTIFLLMAEARVCSHLLTLLRSRTLHLQRVAHADQLRPSVDERRGVMVEELAARVAVLEAASSRAAASSSSNQTGSAQQVAREASVAREVRNAIQPELDALNRAVRRYEKKATLLQMQTESRFSSVDTRLDDAVALAAAAAKHSALPRRRSGGTLSLLARAVFYPLHLLFRLVLLPLSVGRFLLASVGDGPRRVPPATTAAATRGGRSSMGSSRSSPRYDRVPSRVTRR
ncbi:hypothetical protein CP533_6878 [Ophiocordyceps camponoti-saundersi (nom. inval.)]|nr:hypothetical protein CP533_6878 [Ophiocordyceps camponoti-saundersi (nom. inval.)]